MSDEVQLDAGSKPEEVPVAFGVHIMMMQDGQYGMTVTGSPTLGEIQMLVSRSLESVRARIVAETVHAMQQEKRIITPQQAGL